MITTTDYVGNMIYENGALKRILTPEGYWQNGTYYYFLKDHLGSNRVVVTGNGTVVESSNYYPSGMRFGESAAILNNSVQPYRHTGHEMHEMHGLNWIDNNARFRTVSDGSGFTGVDPLAEKMPWNSPYVYCSNNPVSFIDPDGRIPTAVQGARIADHIYNGKVGDVVDGWKLDKVYTSKDNPAYRSGFYSRKVDGVTEYTMANAGTYFENTQRGRNAISEDVEQPFGGSENMRVSIATAEKVSRDVGAAELTFVGHSKGGAEAAGNALATNRNALLYNPAAINAEAYGLDIKSYTGANQNGMTAFVVKGDMLNTFIKQFFAKPIDKVVYLPQQSSNAVTNHLMPAMVKALHEYKANK